MALTNILQYRAVLFCQGKLEPLLTRSQEIEYGQLVQKMMSLLEAKKTLALKLHREPTTAEWAVSVQLDQSELDARSAPGGTSQAKNDRG